MTVTTSTVLPAPPEPAELDAAVLAASEFLSALGVDQRAPHLVDTARRMAASYRELLSASPVAETTFDNDQHHQGWVIVREVPFAAVCAHHVLPFIGTATVGYRPGRRLLGLSKLARFVERHARGLQVQENLTEQVAAAVAAAVPDHGGIGVVVRAEHLCMSLRGARARGSSTVTTAWRGALAEDARQRAEFLALTAGP